MNFTNVRRKKSLLIPYKGGKAGGGLGWGLLRFPDFATNDGEVVTEGVAPLPLSSSSSSSSSSYRICNSAGRSGEPHAVRLYSAVRRTMRRPAELQIRQGAE
ncbi:MAG: hypothetical protein LBG47_10970 [Prevotellaceae bacterium]|nr:hypothetical protein [Prevotellaceae bacterium]